MMRERSGWRVSRLKPNPGESKSHYTGMIIFGCVIEVATFRGLIYTRVCNWDKEHVAVI